MHAHTVRAALVASATFFGTLMVAVPGPANARHPSATPVAIHKVVQSDLGPRAETDDGPGVAESALAILPVESRR